MSARFGIIVPAYNAASYLAWTLDSILAQGEADWQCVIVDDGSADTTATIAQHYVDRDPRFKLVRQPNGGVSKARSTGLTTIDPGTEFLIFLDADDIWMPHALSRLSRAIEEPLDGVKPRAVHAVATFIDNENNATRSEMLDGRLQRLEWRGGKVIEPPSTEPTTSAMLATWPCILTPGIVLVRRTAWEDVGGWDESLSIGEDWELWYRLSLGGPIGFINEPLIRYRVHAGNSQNSWRRPFRLEDARAKIRNSPRSSPEQKLQARRAFRGMARRLGFARLSNGCAAVTRGRFGSGGKMILGGSINLMMSFKPL